MPRRIGLLEELDAVEEARMKVQEYSEGYAISEPRIRFQDSLSPTS